MRLYLSSFRLGNAPDRLVELVGPGASAAVVANALDGEGDDVRAAGVQRELDALSSLGLRPRELDLRDHFDRPGTVEPALAEHQLVWLRGGNVFMLRYALHRSGADGALLHLLAADAVVFGGYSAGPCVLGPSIHDFAVTDPPSVVADLYHDEPIGTGLGVLGYVLVPHVDSPDHPESARLTAVAARLAEAHAAHRSLRDGEVLVVDGATEQLLG